MANGYYRKPTDEQREELERDIARLEKGINFLKSLPEFPASVKLSKDLAEFIMTVPEKYNSWADQTYRAAVSTVANVCESAGRCSANQQIQYLKIGRGSGWECLGLLISAPVKVPAEYIKAAGEVCKMIDTTLLAECRAKLDRMA